MSDAALARRVDIGVYIEGVDVSDDINKYLQSLTYTDSEEDNTDDLQIVIDDREGIWLGSWLNSQKGSQNGASLAVGSIVHFTGDRHYVSSMGSKGYSTKPGLAKITLPVSKNAHPYHLRAINESGKFVSGVYGWVDAEFVTAADGVALANIQTTAQTAPLLKGTEISAVIAHKNPYSDGKDYVLDCGVFAVDSIDVSGPPTKITIKGTSLSYESSVRSQKKSKAWEMIRLSAIAEEIAVKNGMTCMIESAYTPLYVRQEQKNESDIGFLQRLCKNAGIALKVTSKTIVLFDEAEYEQREAVYVIEHGAADVLSYRFSTNQNDTAYSACRVKYTNPSTGKTIEYKYTPRDADKSGPVLEIKEKVNTREEARQLAMKRLRQKNKKEFTADFSLAGNVLLVAGTTVTVKGYGAFDGQYIIEKATHTVSGGYKTGLTLHKALEGY